MTTYAETTAWPGDPESWECLLLDENRLATGAIALGPERVERCLQHFTAMLTAFSNHFRYPRVSPLPRACRDCLRRVQDAIKNGRGTLKWRYGEPGMLTASDRQHAAATEARIVEVTDAAIAARQLSVRESRDAVLHATAQLGDIVSRIAWAQLRYRDVDRNVKTLRQGVRRIRSLTKGWADAHYGKTTSDITAGVVDRQEREDRAASDSGD